MVYLWEQSWQPAHLGLLSREPTLFLALPPEGAHPAGEGAGDRCVPVLGRVHQ